MCILKVCIYNQGEYEIVANDFARARSLFDGTKVEVFEKGMCVHTG